MYHIADWNQRKQEIGAAFRQAVPLSAEADEALYNTLLRRMNIITVQDFAILYNIVEDAIMMARREERPSAPLVAFKDWLHMVRQG